MRPKTKDRTARQGAALGVGLVLLGMAAGTAAAGTFVKTLDLAEPVEAGKTFTVENDGGDITVRTWERNEIQVTATLELLNIDRRNEELFSTESKLTLLRQGNGYRVVVDTPEGLPMRISGKTSVRGELEVSNNGSIYTPRAEALLDLTVPRNCSLVLRTRYGDIQAADLSGSIEAVNTSGLVRLERMGGDARVENSYGEVEVTNVGGDLTVRAQSTKVNAVEVSGRARITSSYESIRLRAVTMDVEVEGPSCELEVRGAGGDVTLTGSYSPIQVSDVGGTLRIDAESCPITVDKVAGDARIRSSYNKIEVRQAGGRLDIEGPSCPVLVDGVRGALTVVNSYDYVIVKRSRSSIRVQGDSSPVEVSEIATLPAEGGIDLETTYKRITLNLPADPSVTVRAETTYGDIDANFPLTLTRNGTQKGEATLGAGACLARLKTSGDILVRAKGTR